MWVEGRKSVFHNFNLKTSWNKASAHCLILKKWNIILLTIIGLKLTKNTSTVYITVHREDAVCRLPQGNKNRLCTLHIALQNQRHLRGVLPPVVGVVAGKHLRPRRLSELRVLLSVDQDTSSLICHWLMHLVIAIRHSLRINIIMPHSGFLSRTVWGMQKIEHQRPYLSSREKIHAPQFSFTMRI